MRRYLRYLGDRWGDTHVSEELRSGIIELLPRLRRFAYALSGDLDRANDLAQETCVRALANSAQWQPGTRLDSWMYRIAQNCWLDQVRARKVRGEVVDIETQTDLAGSDGRDVMERRQTLRAVSAKLEGLPRDQQILVGLICIDGMSYKQAAETLGLPIGTIMSRLSRARSVLAEALEQGPTAVKPALNAKSGTP